MRTENRCNTTLYARIWRNYLCVTKSTKIYLYPYKSTMILTKRSYCSNSQWLYSDPMLVAIFTKSLSFLKKEKKARANFCQPRTTAGSDRRKPQRSPRKRGRLFQKLDETSRPWFESLGGARRTFSSPLKSLETLPVDRPTHYGCKTLRILPILSDRPLEKTPD